MPTIQFKRGALAGLPTGAVGEPLYTTDVPRLYVGVGGGAANTLVGVKHQINGAAAPGAADDSSQGYSPGSVWIDTTNAQSYVCISSAAGAAVWHQTDAASSGGGITQLTGDVTAGPGGGSVAATLAASGVTPGTYGGTDQVPVIVVDAKGRITGINVVGLSGGGTVTSVGITPPAAGLTVSGSPVTTSGNMTLALANDLAALEALTGTDTIYYRSAADTWSPVAIGSGLSFAGGTISATSGSGTVTSVGLSLPSIFAVSGSPVTTSGTLTGELAAQAAATVFAGPSLGSPAAAPTFRALAANDLPAHPGDVLGQTFVNTRESTTSTSPVGLTTAESVSLPYADSPFTVLVLFAATGLHSVANGQLNMYLNVDGVATAYASTTAGSANLPYALAGCVVLSLAAGSHTIALQYSTNTGTASFQNRGLVIFRGA